MMNSVNDSSLLNHNSFDSAVNSLSTEETIKKLPKESNPKNDGTKGIPKDSGIERTRQSEGDGNIVHGSFNNRLSFDLNDIGSDFEQDDEVFSIINDDDDEESDEFGLSYDGKVAPVNLSFENLAAQLGVSDKITKEQLFAYLQSLVSDQSAQEQNSNKIAFVKNLIARFDTISNGGDYITSFNNVEVDTELLSGRPEEIFSTFEFRA